MLFAAGLGKRMGALTRDRPKPLIMVGDRPLIDHALEMATNADIDPVVVNTHYRHEALAAYLDGHAKNLRISREIPDLLETGGGLRAALPLLGNSPVFTLNSDAVWVGENPLLALRNAWDPEIMDGLLLLLPRKNALGHKGQGDFLLDPDGRITRGAGLVYSGAQIIRTELLARIPEKVFSLNRLWDMLIKRQRLFGLVYKGQWCDVGYPEAITTAENLLREHSDA